MDLKTYSKARQKIYKETTTESQQVQADHQNHIIIIFICFFIGILLTSYFLVKLYQMVRNKTTASINEKNELGNEELAERGELVKKGENFDKDDLSDTTEY